MTVNAAQLATRTQSESSPHTRLEAFCDGVFAIALTLLVIEIRPPSVEGIETTSDLWRALQHMLPEVLALLLSFGVILITWVNHRVTMRLVDKTTPSFIYANGFLLLTVVFTPFPTALLGEFVLTDYAAPSVVLYTAVLAVTAVGWLLVSGTAIRNSLFANEGTLTKLREQNRNAWFAIVLYSLLALMGLWFPMAVAIVTTLTWIFWLTLSIRNHE